MKGKLTADRLWGVRERPHETKAKTKKRGEGRFGKGGVILNRAKKNTDPSPGAGGRKIRYGTLSSEKVPGKKKKKQRGLEP